MIVGSPFPAFWFLNLSPPFCCKMWTHGPLNNYLNTRTFDSRNWPTSESSRSFSLLSLVYRSTYCRAYPSIAQLSTFTAIIGKYTLTFYHSDQFLYLCLQSCAILQSDPKIFCGCPLFCNQYFYAVALQKCFPTDCRILVEFRKT